VAKKPRDTARWCEQHSRLECTKLTKKRETCHNSAIDGLDACRMHCGKKTDQAKSEGQANLIRQRFRDIAADEYLDPGDVLAWAVTVAYIDVADYRIQLKDRAAAKDGVAVSADELDRLMRMEADVARMGKMAIDAGVDERRVQMAERVAEQLVAVLRGVVTELGHNPADPKVAAVMHKHLQVVPTKRSA
jgi:hypothetical protein